LAANNPVLLKQRFVMFNFLPRNTKFFAYFDRDAEILVRCAEQFCQTLECFENPKEHSIKLKELEHEADDITHEAMSLLHRSFITPLERGDLRRLILAMDEVVDYMDDAVRRMALYEVESILPEVRAMGKVMLDLARAVRDAVHELRNVRKKNRILQHCIEIQRLEGVGDHLHHIALSSLFKNSTDPLFVIKWKEIIDLIEMAMDSAEEVAHVIEGIVLENA
jgi:predicted phosphate transport protein (TIGR00153 family)